MKSFTQLEAIIERVVTKKLRELNLEFDSKERITQLESHIDETIDEKIESLIENHMESFDMEGAVKNVLQNI